MSLAYDAFSMPPERFETGNIVFEDDNSVMYKGFDIISRIDVTLVEYLQTYEETQFLLDVDSYIGIKPHPILPTFIGFCLGMNKTIITDYSSDAILSKLLENTELFQKQPFTNKLRCIFGIAAGSMHLHSFKALSTIIHPNYIKVNNKLEPKFAMYLNRIAKYKDDDLFKKYIAPEVLGGEHPSEASCVYSFGETLSQMISSDPKDQDLAQLSKIARACMNPKPGMRPKFAQIVSRLLKTEPSLKTQELDEYMAFIMSKTEISKSGSSLFGVKESKQHQSDDYIRLKKSADEGDSFAACKVGRMLQHGDGVPISITDAARYYTMAANAGNIAAQYNLSKLRCDRGSPLFDSAEAAKLMRQAADGGLPEAMAEYGSMLVKGFGVPKDIEKARRYLTQARGGSGFAEYYLGMLEEDAGNYEEAQMLYQQSYTKGNDGALCNLAAMLIDGKLSSPEFLNKAGITSVPPPEEQLMPKNQPPRPLSSMGDSKSRSNSEKTAEDNSNLNSSLRRSQPREKPPRKPFDAVSEGVRLLQLGRLRKHPMSTYNLGVFLLSHGQPGRGTELILEAAELGLPRAMSKAGTLLVRTDPSRAARLLKSAADSGDAQACYNFARLCEDGIGVPRDAAAAVRFFRLAADAGLGAASFRLARMYLSGSGVPLDRTRGMEYLVAAAGAGVGEAEEELARITHRPPSACGK